MKEDLIPEQRAPENGNLEILMIYDLVAFWMKRRSFWFLVTGILFLFCFGVCSCVVCGLLLYVVVEWREIGKWLKNEEGKILKMDFDNND